MIRVIFLYCQFQVQFMFKKRVYNLLESGVKHPTNKDYVSNKGIYWASLIIALSAAMAAINSGIKMNFPITTTIMLSLALFAGSFILLFGSLRFGRWTYYKTKNTETKKTITILLVLLIILVFLLPFFMVYVLGYK